ncbi:hypothetical protein AB6A23_23525 [Paenibacillus tarimensis]
MKKQIVQVALTYIGTIVGAGFASGQGILQFFTAFGAIGIVGVGISTVLFMWLGMKMMLISHRIKAYSYQDFNNYLFGSVFGKAANVLTFIILFGVTVVMLAGTGSIVEEQLGYPYQWGILVTILLSYLVMRKEMNGILAVNSLVVPLMLLFTVLIAVNTVREGDFILWQEMEQEREGSIRWLISAFAYGALNMAMVQAVLVPLGSEVKDEAVLKWGAAWGGIGLGVMLTVSHVALLARMPEIIDYAIPMAEVIKSLGPYVHILFILVVYGEIFTTLVGNVFGITRQIEGLIKIPNNMLVLLILLCCFLFSQIGFSSLLSYLYPLFGYVGLSLLILLIFKRIPQ